MVVSRNLGVGRVFSTTFAPDPQVGFRLAVAGSKGAVQIWDTSTNAAVRRAFVQRVAMGRGDGDGDGEVRERLVGLEESGDEEEEDDEEEEEDEVGKEKGSAESMDED